jgi:hypothetical protein
MGFAAGGFCLSKYGESIFPMALLHRSINDTASDARFSQGAYAKQG